MLILQNKINKMLTFSKIQVQKSNIIIFIMLLIFKFAQCEEESESPAELKKTYPMLHDHGEDEDLGYTFLVSGGYRPLNQNLTKYLVSISREKMKKFFGDGHYCGGAIIRPNVIVTAEHCIKKIRSGAQKLKSIIIIAGTPNRLARNSKTQIGTVKSYEIIESEIRVDLALLILHKNFRIDNVTTAVLPLPKSEPVADMPCTVVGWGRIFAHGPLPARAIYVDLLIWNESRCASYKFYKESFICAGVPSDPERDACAGDSGGPLICNENLYGIVSFGIGCGTPGFPGFYTNVWRYIDWMILKSGEYSLRFNSIFYAFMMALHVLIMRVII